MSSSVSANAVKRLVRRAFEYAYTPTHPKARVRHTGEGVEDKPPEPPSATVTGRLEPYTALQILVSGLEASTGTDLQAVIDDVMTPQRDVSGPQEVED